MRFTPFRRGFLAWVAAVAGVSGGIQIACGAVVTKRLGTGLPPSAPAGSLPALWVAPANRAPAVDGRLDEEAWSAARPAVLGKLRTHGEASPRTEVRLVHKEGILYMGVRLDEPNIGRLERTMTQDDGPLYRDDSIELFISPYPSRGYYQFIVGAGGAVFDRQGHGDPKSFNSGATASVEVGEDGWTMEVAIPMAAMDIGEEVPARWRANIFRNRQAGPEGRNQAFSPTFRGDYDVPERFGYLLFTPIAPGSEASHPATEQSGITVEGLGDGTAVLLFDLSVVPHGAEVHRARLRCERQPMDGLSEDVLRPIRILPFSGEPTARERPKTAGEPIGLAAPWYDSFEMTELARRWAAGQGRPRAWVQSFPGWRKDRTFLDIMFEAEADSFPPAASGVKAFHRSGQTFITWREIEDPVGRERMTWEEAKSILSGLDRQREIRYRVYRSTQPITAEDLPAAEFVAEVKQLSGWNLNGRNIARPVDRLIAGARVLDWHQWNPFRGASVDGDYGRDCVIDRFVIQSAERPLPSGTGLYVHTATRAERAYYAVVTSIDGVENTRDLRAGVNVVGPLAESVAEPEPVLQGELPKMPFFNFHQRRLHYVRWVAPPYTNRPYDYYNWSVGVPSELEDGAALELNLHRDGYSYWRTHYRIEPGSVVLCPHDFPLKTWWYGYHEAYGTLRTWKEGTIRNYTERRLLRFVEWAAGKWSVDRNRILVTGCNGGASGGGALHLGLRYPDMFNLVLAGHGEPDYTVVGEEAERLWGRVDWALKSAAGDTVWRDLDLLRLLQALPARTRLPFVSMTYSDRQEKAHALAEALMAAGHAVVTHTAWGGQRLIPISAQATNWSLPLDLRRDRAMLAVVESGKPRDAVRNGSLLWKTAELVDLPDRFAVTLRQGRGEFRGTVTLRRLQRFVVRPGRRYVWKLEPLGTGDRSGEPGPRGGSVAVGPEGLLVLRDLTLSTGTYRLKITPSP